MSWEIIQIKTVPCPCGKSNITLEVMSGDWNRIEDGQIMINCKGCREKYIIEKEYYSRYLKSDGDGYIYYLTPIGYPKYSGISLMDIYPKTINIYELSFEEFLIKKYTYKSLKEALSIMEQETSSLRLKGIAREIRNDMKTKLKTQKLSEIKKKVEIAIQCYFKYADNGDNRKLIKDKEVIERNEYNIEKKKHQIKLNL